MQEQKVQELECRSKRCRRGEAGAEDGELLSPGGGGGGAVQGL